MNALEFYSGIGGLHLALSRSKAPVSITHAFDWDQNACEVYTANFGPGIAKKTDISTLTASYLVSLHASLWLLSPACQPYTSFLHLVQTVLPELARENAHPTHFFVENVGGFETLWYIPGHGDESWVDRRLPVDPDSDSADIHGTDVDEIRNYLDSEPVEGCGIPDKILYKWGRLFDIVFPSSRRTCCFTRGYTHLVERSGSILQLNEEQDTETVFDGFLQSQLSSTSADAAHAVRTLDPLRLRYFSPEELLRLFHFNPPPPSGDPPQHSFIWPPGISRKTKYRLIGNSVNVTVVQKLIGYLFEEPV
ncbi:S-adenosyl-L-methionine-dependent methyltransferase [Mycena vulgaris]|nr:S-adenosyl-L-methionine-dependent methyltransferase [Mycena vulgaris]